MEYLTTKETAKKWGVNVSLVRRYCTQERIPGVIQRDGAWLIPEDANWQRQVIAVNDSLQDVSGTFKVTDADAGTVTAEGEFSLKAGENRVIFSSRCSTTEQKLFLIEWQLSDGTRGVNHAITGHPRFSLEKYREWLQKIAALDNSFDTAKVGLGE